MITANTQGDEILGQKTVKNDKGVFHGLTIQLKKTQHFLSFVYDIILSPQMNLLVAVG